MLRIPVRYYRHRPSYFSGWSLNLAPRWGEHWGRDWEQRRSGWDRWDHHSVPRAAPLPSYQRQYSGSRYPRATDQQYSIESRNYRYKPREAITQQYFQRRAVPNSSRPKTPPPAQTPRPTGTQNRTQTQTQVQQQRQQQAQDKAKVQQQNRAQKAQAQQQGSARMSNGRRSRSRRNNGNNKPRTRCKRSSTIVRRSASSTKAACERPAADAAEANATAAKTSPGQGAIAAAQSRAERTSAAATACERPTANATAAKGRSEPATPATTTCEACAKRPRPRTKSEDRLARQAKGRQDGRRAGQYEITQAHPRGDLGIPARMLQVPRRENTFFIGRTCAVRHHADRRGIRAGPLLSRWSCRSRPNAGSGISVRRRRGWPQRVCASRRVGDSAGRSAPLSTFSRCAA